MNNVFPKYIPLALITERLPIILPEGTRNRNYCIREIAAKTIFTMIYVGAVSGYEKYFAPFHAYRMTEEQSLLEHPDARENYRSAARNKSLPGKKWYADNTREPIRDETLRDGLIPLGIVSARTDIATTSSSPRYWIESHFVDLFDPDLSDEDFIILANNWREHHLSKDSLSRITLAQAYSESKSDVAITYPNGEVRILSHGPSSIISKAVIEVFTKNYLSKPVVLWLSESGNKVVTRDDKLAQSIGIKIDASRNLPDIILVDLAADPLLLVFVEVVATDGAVTSRRQNAIYEITDAAGFKRDQVAFVTAYSDRDSIGSKKTITGLAWNSFAWFFSEPEKMLILDERANRARLSDLIKNNHK